MDQQDKELIGLLRQLHRSQSDIGDHGLFLSDIAALGERGIRSIVVLLDSAHPDRVLRAMAARSLGYFHMFVDAKFDMSDAIPALRWSLTDRDWSVVFHAADSLWSICREQGWRNGLSEADILTTLLRCLHCDDSDVRLKAVSRLMRWRRGDIDRLVPPLRYALNDPNPEIRFISALVLRTLGPPHESGVTDRLLNSREASDRFVAALTLISFGEDDHEVYIPVLIDAYLELDDHMCEGATYEFRHLEIMAEPLLPILAHQLNDNPNRKIRLAAATVVGLWAPDFPTVLPILTRALDEVDAEILCVVIRALRFRKIEAKAVSDRLVTLLIAQRNKKATDRRERHRRSDLIYELCHTLGETGASGKHAVPLLHKFLNDKKEDEDVKEFARWTLATFYGLK